MGRPCLSFGTGSVIGFPPLARASHQLVTYPLAQSSSLVPLLPLKELRRDGENRWRRVGAETLSSLPGRRQRSNQIRASGKDSLKKSLKKTEEGHTEPQNSDSSLWISRIFDEMVHSVGLRMGQVNKGSPVLAVGQAAVVLSLCSILAAAAVQGSSSSAMAEAGMVNVADAGSSLRGDEEFVRAPARPDIPMNRPLLWGTSVASRIPEQVHISLAGPNKMMVTWVTSDVTAPSVVEFGTAPGQYSLEASGESESYTYIIYRSGLIHHVVLGTDEDPLPPSTQFYYRCGRAGKEYSFKTPPPSGPETPLNIAIVGDLGQTGWSVSTLEHLRQFDHDVLILAGDLSYADRYQPRWDTWGVLVEPGASSRPWMTVEGNHEIEGVLGLEEPFKAYNARFPMPHDPSGSPSNHFYSFESGPAHFLMLGSYTDFSPDSPQQLWLKADLAKVDREKTPWLIAILHAPWYNSNYAHQGNGQKMMDALEDILYAANVDMVFAGHVHAYERTGRVFKGRTDPCGIIHFTVGDGGNREGLETNYFDPPPEWSLKREASFGHGELRLLNGSAAHWTWQRNDDDASVMADELWIQPRICSQQQTAS